MKKSSAPNVETIKVMSFNLSYSFPSKTKKNSDSWIQEQMDQINADIYFFQEARGKKYFKPTFLEYEGFHFKKKGGTAIYSKFKIVDRGKIDFGTFTNSVVWVDVEVKGKIIRAYSVHLKSNRISTGEIDKFNDLNKDYEKNIEETKNVLGKYSNKSLIRAEQVQLLLDHIATCPHPIIVGGDFNEPPQSYVYKQMLKGFNDSFRERGFGIGSTYAGKIPFLRIDYVFLDRRFEVVSHRKLGGEWFDHYPVVVEINI